MPRGYRRKAAEGGAAFLRHTPVPSPVPVALAGISAIASAAQRRITPLSSADVAYSAGSRQLNTTRLMQAIALAFLAVKVTFIFTAGPASDEVYYWMWGRIPELSYFDHPPLHAWLLGLSLQRSSGGASSRSAG